MMFFGNLSFFQENVKESSITELRAMLGNNDVDKIVVVTGAEKSAEVYLKESALNKPEYKDVAHTRFGGINKGPQYTLTMLLINLLPNFIKISRNCR
jgi:hypothetical protein